jgi:hypothetical protein
MTTTINIRDLIAQEANSQGVPPAIALAVAQQESEFNQGAIGSQGEVGVFQLMPKFFAQQGDLSDVFTNVNLGVGYLAQLYRKYGDWNTALAAYNWGPGNVDKSLAAAPSGFTWSTPSLPKTVWSYVQSVLGIAGASSPASLSSAPDLSSATAGDAPAISQPSLDPSLIAPILLVGAGLVMIWWAWD